MSNPQVDFGSERSPQQTDGACQLDAIGWAVFFIWIGLAMLAGLLWGWFLLGTGILILAVQIGRSRIGAEVEKFWIACAAVFLVGGVWQLVDMPWPLAPLLLIILGVFLLGKAVSHARS
jgi:hypothetical protein